MLKTDSHLVNAVRRTFQATIREIDRKLTHLRSGEALRVVTREYPSRIDRRYASEYAIYTERKSGNLWETILWAQ